MAKFKQKYLTRMNAYLAPSGISYDFVPNQYTVVSTPIDVEYFRNNRRFAEMTFTERIGLKKTEKVDEGQHPEESFEEWLLNVDGVGKKLARKIVDIFGNIENLRAEVSSGKDLTNDGLTKKQSDLLIDAIKQKYEAQ